MPVRTTVLSFRVPAKRSEPYQKSMKPNHDSKSKQQLKTTQYMSHGVS